MNSYDDALSINPDYANALNSKANALDKLNRKDEALDIYQRLSDMKPENAVYLLNYAACLYETDNLEKSEEMLGRAEQLYETQKNDFDEDTISAFEKNSANLREKLNNKKNN